MRKDATILHCWLDFVTNESRHAYYKMYEHYYPYLVYLGVKKGFEAESVKDTINDIFLYFWEKRNQLTHIQQPHNYIITFFIRSLYKGETHARMFTSSGEQYEEYAYEAFVEPACDVSLLDREKQHLLLTVINRQMEQLPPKQRQIIYQKYFLGLSYEEIAKTNHISINTVYNTVYAAMDKLRAIIPKNTIMVLVSALAVSFLFFLS